jgi:hypothetical protein
LDLGFWIEEGDWEVLGDRAIDFGFEIWDFGLKRGDWEVLGDRAGDFGFEILDFRLKRGIGRFWAGLSILDLRFGILD